MRLYNPDATLAMDLGDKLHSNTPLDNPSIHEPPAPFAYVSAGGGTPGGTDGNIYQHIMPGSAQEGCVFAIKPSIILPRTRSRRFSGCDTARGRERLRLRSSGIAVAV